MVLQNLLADARKARLADNYDAAMSLCSAYLSAHPDDPEGESLLGLCEIETNRKEGARRIEHAALTKPDSQTIQFNLSILRERQGDIRAAVQCATNAAKLAPGAFECWAQLGKLLGMAGKYREAVSALEQALKIRPDHAGAQALLAGAALECGEYDKCELAITAIEGAAPKSQVTQLKAHLARKRGQWSELRAIANDWLAEQPTNEEARLALAHATAQLGYFDEAAEIYGPLCAGKRPKPYHAAAMGRYRLGGRHLDEAKRWFEAAIALDPNNAEAAYGLARLAHFAGHAEQTEAWCRRALASEPAHADAFALLAEVAKGDALASDLAAVDQALKKPNLRESERITLLFAKGDLLHSQKNPKEAFDAWAAANRAKRAFARISGAEYSPERQSAKISRLIELFPEIAPAATRRSKSATPIFIVGMPRSGTTLLEAAIAAHPEVDAAGEIPAMPFILEQFLQWTDDEEFKGGDIPARKAAEWRSLYESQARRFGAAGAPRFTDKQPSNFMSVGLAASLYPEARFIYLRRNPVETGFSIFRRNFTQQWEFSTDLPSIAHYYAEHCRISDHWLQCAPERVKFVQYEALVANFENSLKDLIAFCGLPWDDRCLTYHEQDRAVMTFSAAQVRKPPTAAHLNSTAPYAANLSELSEALARFGVDLETGALTYSR
jgi:tetratricopeptide (TPR) repeat protein